MSLVRCERPQCAGVLVLCPCPLLVLFSKEMWEKEMPAFRSPERHKPFGAGFVAQGDSMRDVGGATSHGAGVWARHKDELKSSWGE